MAAAFLPWDKWISHLIHPLKVAIAKRIYQSRRERSLARSASWTRVKGTVQRINWDSSYPREEIVYVYSTESGYHSGSFWRWFDSPNLREVRVDDRITLGYDPEAHDMSVFLSFE